MTKAFFKILSICLFFVSTITAADNLYIELVQGANVADKDLQDAIKQLREQEELEVRSKLPVGPFHYRNDPVEPQKQPFCQTCHLSKPHRSDQRKRSFLNMHTRYIACETCHLQPENIQLDYRWLAFGHPNAGQEIDVSLSVHSQIDRIKTSILPRPRARIAAFYKGIPATLFKDDPFSSEIEEKWKELPLEDKARLKVGLHVALSEKGRDCDACHSEKQDMLELELLGANEKLSRSIRRNKIADFFSRYEKDSDTLKISDILR